MNSLYLIWELARKDLLLFVADRRGVLLCFAVPVILASIFGAVFHRPDASENIRPAVRIVTDGDSPRVRRIAEALSASTQLDARSCDAATARRWLAEESAGVVVHLPDSLGQLTLADLSKQGTRPTVLLRQHPKSQIEGRWVEGILTEVVLRELARDYLTPLLGLSGGKQNEPLQRPFAVERNTECASGALAVHAFSHSFCGMTLQYLLFWGMDSGLLFLRERRLGIWRRLRCAPVGFFTLLAGKALATALIALLLVLVTFGVGAAFFGVRITGSWCGFALMAISAALLSSATGLVVASLGGNEARARSVSILTILALSLLGGLWLPGFLLPQSQKLSLGLPTTWAARGLEGVVWQGMELSQAWPCALALTGFSGLFLAVAYWRLRGSEARRGLDNRLLATRLSPLLRDQPTGFHPASPTGSHERSQKMRGTRFLLVALLVSVPAMAQTPAVPTIAMEDQFERSHDVKDHRGHVLVLIFGDRASAKANQELGEKLHVTFHPSARGQSAEKARMAPVIAIPGATAATSPNVLAIPVACVGKVPGLVKRFIRGQIKGGSPEVPVWLDFEDTMKTLFGLKAGVPNVVILDTKGRYRHHATGASSPEAVQKLVGVIEGLRREPGAATGK